MDLFFAPGNISIGDEQISSKGGHPSMVFKLIYPESSIFYYNDAWTDIIVRKWIPAFVYVDGHYDEHAFVG